MSHSMTIQKTHQAGGKTFIESASLSGNSIAGVDRSMGPAKAGSLTTRTSDTVGTLTMATGHAFTTGARLDMYWTVAGVSGHRRGVVIGTVAGDSVPITGGVGDILPAAASAVTAMVPIAIEIRFDGNDLTAYVAGAEGKGIIVLASAADVELAAFVFPGGQGADEWYPNNGKTSQLVGDVVEKCWLSTGEVSAKGVRFVGLHG